MLRIGDRFYDERNGRYLTVDGVGCDPKCYDCIQEEPDVEGDLYISDRVLMMENELLKFRRLD